MENKSPDNPVSANGSDRIFHLPDNVIDRILFFLPAKDAARASILSKTWRRVWKSLPIFSFSSNGLTSSENFKLDHGSFDAGKYMDFLDKSLEKLHNCKVRIGTFQLDLCEITDERHALRMGQIMELTTKNYIKTLLLVAPYPYSCLFRSPRVPLATFAANSFSVLHLENCVLKPEVLGDNPKFPCLQELCLSFVYDLEDQMVQSLLANCPLLETFSIVFCGGVKRLLLGDLPMLKEVKIMGVRKVVIEAINIQRLHYQYLDNEPLQLHLVSCDNIKELSLFAYFTVDYIQELVANLPHLEILAIKPFKTQKMLKITSQKLKYLTLYTLLPRGVGPRKVKIDAPNLRSYNCYLEDLFSPVAVASRVSINTSTPRRAILNVTVSWSRNKIPIHFYSGLKNYLQLFKYNVLTINAYFHEREPILAPQGQNSAAPPAYLDRLNLIIVRSYGNPFDFAAFLDCCFWICRPKIIYAGSETEFIEFSLDKLMSWKENPQSCSHCQDEKCWRHYLEDIEITQIFGKNKDVQNLTALNNSSQPVQRCLKLQLELKWKTLGQKRNRESSP